MSGARRPTLTAALALALAPVLLGGCGGGETTGPAPSTSTPPTVTTAPAATTVPPGPTGAPPAGPPPTGGTVPPTDDGPTEVPNDPIQRTVTGTVERTAGCTVLVVGSRRWPLTGGIADTLAAGGQYRVTGNLTQPPPACANEDGPGLQVTHAAPA